MFQESFPSLLKSAHEFHQITKAPVDEEKEIIKYVFGKDFSSFFEGKKTKTHLAERFFSLIFDRGLRRKVCFNKVVENDPPELDPIPMFNRQSFLSELRRRIGFAKKITNEEINFESEKPFVIFKFDLADVFLANKAVDDSGNRAGDYNLNLAALAMKEAVEILSSVHELKMDKNDLIVGRYGGDEFVIACIGDLSTIQENQEKIEALIKEKIKKRFGYFKKGEKIEREGLRLKDDKVEIITVPDNEMEKKLFFSFLERGMVTNREALDKAKDYILQSGVDLREYLQNSFFQNEEYRKLKIEEKIKYLTERHPEYKIIFALADFFDKKDKSNRSDKEATSKILYFIESYMLDPLLDEIVITRFDLKYHLKQDKFKVAHSFELKIKETNDQLGDVYSDILITKLWREKLYPFLSQYIDEGKVSLGRFGGTIYLLEKGEGLPKNVRKKLKKITGLKLGYKGKEVYNTIGYARVDTSTINKDSKPEEIDQVVDKILGNPTASYLNRSFRRFLNNGKKYQSFIDILNNLKINPQYVYQGNDYEVWLFAKYFTGKRKEERIRNGLNILDELKKILPSESSNIKNIEGIRNLLSLFLGS